MSENGKHGKVKGSNENNIHSKANGSHAIEELTSTLLEPQENTSNMICADARNIPIASSTIDLIVTSPPYWRKRDYEVKGQIGQERSVQEYVDNILTALREWRRVLRPTGSIFLNIGDTYYNKNLSGVPARIEIAARDDGWIIRNRIIWAKKNGMPDPAQNRLVSRHEFILHLVSTHDYYYDIFDYASKYGNGSNPGDVWTIKHTPNKSDHLAPFPEEIVERAIRLGCPLEVCSECGEPRRRIVKRTDQLDPNRPQARRAMEIAKEKGLTAEHIAAIQATGISDAGKALKVQNGTGRNAKRVKVLAAEAKKVLGGYFREFTFAQRESVGWTDCKCGSATIPGIVLDPFMGTGTTLKVATRLGRSAIGVDLAPPTKS